MIQEKSDSPIEVVLFKGDHRIISNPLFREPAEKLYRMIVGTLEKLNIPFRIVKTTDCTSPEMMIPSTATHLIAHSLGANILKNNYSTVHHPNVRILILLDPAIYSYSLENLKHLKMISFISPDWPDVKLEKYGDVHRFDDDHFFSASLPEIARLLEKIF
jgi:hypothetical protein